MNTNKTSSVHEAPAKLSWRLMWMLPAGFSLMAGLNAALLLVNLPAPMSLARLAEVHGPLLVLGFVATLVSLERATALRKWYGYFAPGLLGLGGILISIDAVPLAIGKWVLVAGTLAFTAVYYPLYKRRYDIPVLTQLLSTSLAFAGALLWATGFSMDRVLPWLFVFIILTILAERVELTSIAMGHGAGYWLIAFAWAATISLLLGISHAHLGAISLGVTLTLMTFWFVKHDIARKTINARHATRYMAACMLGGYVWLAVAGIVLLAGFPTSQPAYDALVHSIFLGFTMSMIMAHATTILPAVLHIDLPYRPIFWIPAILLHLSLVIRVLIGDGLGNRDAWVIGGALGVAALLLFVLTAVTSAILGKPKTSPEVSSPLNTTAAPHATQMTDDRDWDESTTEGTQA